MPFNMALAGVGGRVFILAQLASEDLALAYNVEAQVISQFPTSGGTILGDEIQLTLSGVDFIAATTTGYAIDADGLDDGAIFTINMIAGSVIRGRGGNAGKAGDGIFDPEPPAEDQSTVGSAGSSGGTCIRFGCKTRIIGTGTIESGHGGGGGGGGGAPLGIEHGGGGGGGGSPLGTGGLKGLGSSGDGTNGTDATRTSKGIGGAAGGANAGAGGNGGEVGTIAQAGVSGVKAGGAAGADGNAIDSQGFAHSEGSNITVTGPII